MVIFGPLLLLVAAGPFSISGAVVTFGPFRQSRHGRGYDPHTGWNGPRSATRSCGGYTQSRCSLGRSGTARNSPPVVHVPSSPHLTPQ